MLIPVCFANSRLNLLIIPEASDLFVYSKLFMYSEVPIAYVGCQNTMGVNNTIDKADHWVIRI